MNPKQTVASRNTRQMRYLVAFALFLLAASLLYVGCKPGAGGGNTTSTTQGASPTATPSPTPSGSPGIIRGDDPIVVTGGSVDLDFKDYYKESPAGSGTYICSGCVVWGLDVYEDGTNTGQPCLIPDPTDCEITLDDGGETHDVKITGMKDSVTITLNSGMFKQKLGSNPSRKYFVDKSDSLKSVKVKGGKDCEGVNDTSRIEVHVEPPKTVNKK